MNLSAPDHPTRTAPAPRVVAPRAPVAPVAFLAPGPEAEVPETQRRSAERDGELLRAPFTPGAPDDR